MASSGLKPWEHGDVDEGLAIMGMMEDDREDHDGEDDDEAGNMNRMKDRMDTSRHRDRVSSSPIQPL